MGLIYSVMLALVYFTQAGLYKQLAAVLVEHAKAAEGGRPPGSR